MAFQLITLLSGVLVGWARKGSLWAIPNVGLRFVWILPVAYVLQHISISYLTGFSYESTLLISYIGMLIFAVFNIKVPGIVWAFVGTLANFLVMVVNGLRMPAYMPSVKSIFPQLVNKIADGTYVKSIAMGPNTHLSFLGDIFAFKLYPPSLISIGDILFAIGIIVLIQFAMRSKRSETPLGTQSQAS